MVAEEHTIYSMTNSHALTRELLGLRADGITPSPKLFWLSNLKASLTDAQLQ